MKATTLLIATHNPGKVVELHAMLSDHGVRCISLSDAGVTHDVPETGDTFVDNAVLKATGYAEMTGLLTLADDSGLEVDALDGAPGVHTKRYGGDGLTDEARFRYLLAQLAEVPAALRTARFRCVMALASPKELHKTTTGVLDGEIARVPAGTGGFGYDPVFYVPAYAQTLAELPRTTKNEISHRSRALAAMTPFLQQMLAP